LDTVFVETSPDGGPHPCLRCGACCAHYRASFYWAEADDETPGGVPVDVTEVVSVHLRAMRGTNQAAPRCIALQGTIGRAVHCAVHPQRPSTCRDYLPSFENGLANPRCDAARAAHGLPPLTPADWVPQTRELAAGDALPAAEPGLLGDLTGTPGAEPAAPS
jgi:Fe-S-cluster containining protein